MNLRDRRERFRAVLNGDKCVRPASVYDPLSARVAQDIGYEIGMFAGSVASLTVLGAPDLIVLTLSEFAGQIRRISRGSDLPLMVDADHGYGNALNVMRCVEELETAGVSGMSVEDTELPQPFGTGGKPRLLSLDEGLGKMRAAVAAKPDPDMIVAGRTSAIAMAGVDDAKARVRAYTEAKVDAIFLVGAKTRAEMDAVSAETHLPIVLGSATGELSDDDYLASVGVRIALQGHAPFMAAVQAVYDTLKAQRDGVPNSELKGLPQGDFMQRMTRVADYEGQIEDYL